MKLHQVPLGAPCWFEFSSTDAPRSLQFFCDLFGWTTAHQDMGEFGTYTFLEHAGGVVGAHWQMPPAQREQGVPSNWGVYFKVQSVDQSHAQALAMGATEYVPPMPVSDYGRMSVLADPGGAVFSIWEEVGKTDQPLIMFEEHAVGWTQLATRAAPAVKEFYSKLLGLTHEAHGLPGGYESYIFKASGTRYGSIIPMTKEWDGIPSNWGVYIVVADTDACLQRMSALGGQIAVPAFDAPGVGRIAVIKEPTGGYFSVIALATA